MKSYPLLIGRDPETGCEMLFEGTEHVGLHARSGTGKSSQFVIPNCFAWPGSLVVLDIKSQCWDATAGHRRQRLGQDIVLFNPTAQDSRTHRWNPFDAINRTSLDRFDQIIQLAYALVPETWDGGNAARFWEPAGRLAFTSVVALLAETPNEALTPANVLHTFMRGDYRDWLINAIENRRQIGRPYSMPAVEGVSDFLSGHPDQVDGIRKTVSTLLQQFWNPRVAAATEVSDFDISQLRRKPTTIYVSIAPSHIPRMRPLLRLLFDQIINTNTETTPEQDPTLDVPILLMLDEFVQLGKMVTLAHAAQFVRGYGIRLAYVIQDKEQLNELYGHASARDIFSNLGVEIVFGTGDIKLAKELEERIGDDTMMFDTINRPKWFARINWRRQHVSQHPHRRPLIYDQEIVHLDPKKQIVLRPGMPSALTERITWYDDPHYKSLVLPPPYVPALKVDVKPDDGSIKFGKPSAERIAQPITSTI